MLPNPTKDELQALAALENDVNFIRVRGYLTRCRVELADQLIALDGDPGALRGACRVLGALEQTAADARRMVNAMRLTDNKGFNP
jgi:hypothetical protein